MSRLPARPAGTRFLSYAGDAWPVELILFAIDAAQKANLVKIDDQPLFGGYGRSSSRARFRDTENPAQFYCGWLQKFGRYLNANHDCDPQNSMCFVWDFLGEAGAAAKGFLKISRAS